MKEDHYSDFANEWTQRMRNGKNIIHEYLAKPALYKQIGDVKGKEILCIGCGSGEECGYFMSQGAKKVIGIDLSPALIEIAKKSYPNLEFQVMDMENMNFSENSFDLIVSSLVMHYVSSWNKTLESIRKILRNFGKTYITTNHPIRFGAQASRMKDKEIFVLGYVRYMENNKQGIVSGDYLSERKIEDMWFRNRMKVTYYNRPISALFKDIIDNGFDILDFQEPKPEEWVKEKNSSFYDIHSKIPLIILFEIQNIK